MTLQENTDFQESKEILEVALEAIKRGALSVSLGHESMGYEFPAPIGWMLWIDEKDDTKDTPITTSLVTHQIGCSVEDIVLPEGLRDKPEEAVVEKFIELFIEAFKNGWSADYVRETTRFGDDSDGWTVNLHKMSFSAPNWDYHAKGGRKNGEQVSVNVHISQFLERPSETLVWVDDGGVHRSVALDYAEDLLRKDAPNRAPVAHFDDAKGEWVIPGK